MKVMIAESNYPDDFYTRALDGASVSTLLDTMRVKNELRYTLDFDHLKRAIKEGIDRRFRVLHISCHGDKDGIATSNNEQPSWEDFAKAFQSHETTPPVLIMSSCCGASSGISDAFRNKRQKPEIIIGSTEALGFSEYAAAWAILYHRFLTDGLNKKAARTALKQMVSVVHNSFMYRRWDKEQSRYLNYPPQGKSYKICEIEDNK